MASEPTVTISESNAESLAMSIRDEAARRFNRGMYDSFSQGLNEGQLVTIGVWMPARSWVIQGIQNELRFLRRKADMRGLG